MIRLLQKEKKYVSIEDFEQFVYEWNIENPIDRYYRKKYNIKFNSPEHRVCSFIDMAFEFYEDYIHDIEQNDNEYKPGTGNWLKERNIEDDINDDQLADYFGSGDLSVLDDGR